METGRTAVENTISGNSGTDKSELKNFTRIDIFKEFASYMEYPMVIFEAKSGKVIDINYEAEVLLGKDIKNISIEPGRAFTRVEFWNVLRTKKSLIWHRIRLVADSKEYLVSGLVNEMTVDDKLVYSVLFEFRADMNIGSLTLERIVNHGKLVGIHVSIDDDNECHVEYVSQNINRYGYTRAQFYDGGKKASDVVCPEDLDNLMDNVSYAIKQHLDDSSFECRLVTEENELIPVRLMCHFYYDNQWKVTDYEVVALDRSEELKKSSENEYLSNAMFKMKSVVIVKSFHAGKRTLKYISPNAVKLGMNVEALRQGNKLTEDYIHPEDRDGVLESVYQAVANGISDYVQTCRMVRDDGKIIWVENQLTINRISEGEAEISYLLTDITEQKDLERELESVPKNDEEKTGESKKEVGNDDKSVGQSFDDITSRLQLMTEGLGKNSRYYSVALSEDGKIMTRPVGPADNIGVFYDLFERPEIRERLEEIVEQVKIQLVPKSIDIVADGFPVHITFCPLMSDNLVKAFWVLAAINGEGVDEMGTVVEVQWQLANSIVESFFAKDRVEEEVKNKKLTELKLKRDKQERKILREILNISVKEGDSGLLQICQRLGSYLEVSYIGIYTENKETGNAVKYYTWSPGEADGTFFDHIQFSSAKLGELRMLVKDDNQLMATGSSGESFLREFIVSNNMKFIALEPMIPEVGTWGYMVFGDRKRDTEFDNSEQQFVSDVVKVVQEIVFRDKAVVRNDLIREGFLEAYDYVKDAIFIKNNESGEIIFANKVMDKLFGYSIVGMQAQDIVNDQMEQYRSISGGMRKRVIANNKVTKWQSYLKELDRIMNVTEIRLNVITTSDLSLVILKKNK